MRNSSFQSGLRDFYLCGGKFAMSYAMGYMFAEFWNLTQMRFVIYFLLMSYGIMCAKTCSHGIGVDFKVPVIVGSVVFN
jgi:hypothetical protein